MDDDAKDALQRLKRQINEKIDALEADYGEGRLVEFSPHLWERLTKLIELFQRRLVEPKRLVDEGRVSLAAENLDAELDELFRDIRRLFRETAH